MDRLFADCAADQACRAAYADVATEFKTVLARFDKGPVVVKAINAYTRQEQEVTVSPTTGGAASRARHRSGTGPSTHQGEQETPDN